MTNKLANLNLHVFQIVRSIFTQHLTHLPNQPRFLYFHKRLSGLLLNNRIPMIHVQIFSLETNTPKPNASSASRLPNDACFPVSTFLGSCADTNPPRFRPEDPRSNPYTKSPSLCAPPRTFGSYFDRKNSSFPRLSHLRKPFDFLRSSE